MIARLGPYAITLPLGSYYSPWMALSNVLTLFKVNPFYFTLHTLPYSSPTTKLPSLQQIMEVGAATPIYNCLTMACCS